MIAASKQEKMMGEIVGSVNQNEFDNCDSWYEHEFMKGCMLVERITKDICNNAEDAG